MRTLHVSVMLSMLGMAICHGYAQKIPSHLAPRQGVQAFIGKSEGIQGYSAQSTQDNGACLALGPSLDDTVKYVTQHSSNIKYFAINQKIGTLVYEGGSHFIGEVTLHYMKLPCRNIWVTRGGEVQIKCPDNTPCLFKASGDEVPGRDKFDSFAVEGADPDAAGNLARALSHLIYLLQTDYRASHNHDSDPFAPH